MWRAVGSTYGIVTSFRQKSVKFIDMQRPSTEAVAAFEKRLNLMHEDSPLMAREGGERGRFCYDKPTKALWVTAIDGQWVLVTRVQVASRTIRTAAEFADGQRLRSGQLFHFDQPNDHDN
ncbi:hypothetical protein DYB30_006202 [Aphanomyces astaci]|nr:hypothetical protein AaE_009360 [Aphanomyces astaci]RHY63326.1 hypothetical protein DYB38_005964 [Aphanomyces astaci]RHY67810.1 hypothetical protein DYB34_005904 [Aphanomyces astaci]RHY78391.1 hypothetical protein DYB30_006202 [Aphanomyces astaci]